MRTFSLFLLVSVFAFPQAAISAAPTQTATQIDVWIQKADQLHLDQDVQWLNLGHYRSTIFGGVRSQTAGKGFFNSGEDGFTNPKKELVATIRALATPGAEDDTHPQCLFPARLKWLTIKLGWNIADLPKPKCAKYDEYFERLHGRSATLVFSSYFLNSPSSTFGHTLIRVNKTEHSVRGRRFELLDHGLNYAALLTTSNPVLYAFFSIAGLFPGTFTSTPYYYKVREYNDFEARDLWEYDLNLNPSEVDLLVAHFWELANTQFNYFYLTQNCSYHMLSAIDAAAPQFHLQDQLHYWVIPTDTIKIAYETPGLVREVHFRPAVRSQFRFRTAKLSPEALNELTKIVHDKKISSSLTSFSPPVQADILDAAMDYVDWHFADKLLMETGGPTAFKQSLLLARSQVPIQSGDLKMPIPEREAPHFQHGSARAWISGGSSDRTGSFARVANRFALHDLLDPLRGFPEYGQIEFLNFVVRQNFSEHSWWLEDFSLFSLVSLSELETFNQALSWRFRLGGKTVRDSVCENCFAFTIDAAPGLAFRLLNLPKTSLVAFMDAEFMASPRFRGTHYRLRAGPSVLARTTLTPNFQILTSIGQKWPILSELTGSLEFSAGIRWSFLKKVAVDLKSTYFTSPRFWEHYAGLMYYY